MEISLVNDIHSHNLFQLEKKELEDSVQWKYEDKQYMLKIVTDKEERTVKSIFKSDNIIESEEEIKQKFLDILFEDKMSKFINQEDGFDDSVDGESEEINKINPYDPNLFVLIQKHFLFIKSIK